MVFTFSSLRLLRKYLVTTLFKMGSNSISVANNAALGCLKRRSTRQHSIQVMLIHIALPYKY